MTLKILLVKNGETIFELPIIPNKRSNDELKTDFNTIEDDFEKFSRIFDALSHQTRLQMMRHLIEEDDQTMSFADFMHDLDLNPKTVWENSRKLSEGGLLKKTARGKYVCSELGQTAFLMINLTLHHLIEEIEKDSDLSGGEYK